jgi:hypothetical protein
MVEQKRQSSVDIAYKILKKRKCPMPPKEIIKIAMSRYELVMKGKTPDATLNSNFINEIKRRKKSNREQRFVRVSRGKWGLVEYIGVHYEIDE